MRYRALDYLLYGSFVRTPDIDAPMDSLMLSRLSIYAGRGKGERVSSFEGEFPLIYAQAWQAESGKLGIALASISDEDQPVEAGSNAIRTAPGRIHHTH